MKRIDKMLAFVSEDGESEGVVAIRVQGAWMPLVGADIERINGLRAAAQDVADKTGRRIRLLRFTVREELEVIEPARPEREQH